MWTQSSKRMKPSPYYDRIVDVAEELVKFTLLTRGISAHLTDRYSERKESAIEVSRRLNLEKAVMLAMFNERDLHGEKWNWVVARYNESERFLGTTDTDIEHTSLVKAVRKRLLVA